MNLTRAQREALKAVYDRGPLASCLVTQNNSSFRMLLTPEGNDRPASYREFRRHVRPAYDCIMLPWQGMWLGIERDGYTHS